MKQLYGPYRNATNVEITYDVDFLVAFEQF